jgi:ribosomal-protein-alanine N-acetyltransferase
VLLAESEKRPIGYLSAVRLGRTLGIEEVAVLPDFRRMGVGRALLAVALHREIAGAVLSVNEDNKAARALYRSLGFAQVARRMVMERRNE